MLDVVPPSAYGAIKSTTLMPVSKILVVVACWSKVGAGLWMGAVWTGVYPRDERVEAVRRVLGLPADVVPLNLIPVGYPADNPAPKQELPPTPA